MDKNLAAFLDPLAYTVSVVFQKDQDAALASPKAAGKTYTYVTNIPGLRVGDWVIVNTRVGYQAIAVGTYADMQDINEVLDSDTESGLVLQGKLEVVRVVAVHKEVQIEPNDDKEYSWIISKLDFTPFIQTVNRNKQIVTTAQTAYKRNLRRSFADRILADLAPEDQAKLTALLAPKA